MSKLFVDITKVSDMYVEIKGHMKDSGLYNEEDEIAIQVLADLMVQANLLSESLREHGPVFKTVTDNGADTMKQNPAMKNYTELQPKIRTLFDDLGLTAKARKGDSGGGDEAKAIKDFLNG